MSVSNIVEHDQKIADLWNDVARKRDTIYVLGDVGFDLELIKKLPGFKKLVLGNHDTLPVTDYLTAFHDVVGPVKYKQHWISHMPIHESELFSRPCIHGHTHSNGIANEMYVNVSVEMTRGMLVNYQDIKSGRFTTAEKVNKEFEEIVW